MSEQYYMPQGVMLMKPAIRRLTEILNNSHLPTEGLSPLLAEHIGLQNDYMTQLCQKLSAMQWLDDERFRDAANDVYREGLRRMLYCDNDEELTSYVESFNNGYGNSLYRKFLIDYSIFDPNTQLLDRDEFVKHKTQIDAGSRNYMAREHGDDAQGSRAAHEIALFECGMRIQAIALAEEVAYEAFDHQQQELLKVGRGWNVGRS